MNMMKKAVWVLAGLCWVISVANAAQSEVDATDEERLRVIAAYDAAVAEGDLTGAVRLVLEFTEKTLGENAPETVKLTHRYGLLLLEDGEYREATKVLRQALKRSNAAFGKSGGDAFDKGRPLAGPGSGGGGGDGGVDGLDIVAVDLHALHAVGAG